MDGWMDGRSACGAKREALFLYYSVVVSSNKKIFFVCLYLFFVHIQCSM